MPYLVDSDIMVDFTRGNAKAADYLDSLSGPCFVSAITPLELIGGARSQREVNDLDFMISAYEQIPPDGDITRRAYYLHEDLRALPRVAHARCANRCNRDRRRLDTRFEEPEALPDDR